MQANLKSAFSNVIIAYKSKSGLWRGFVLPYNITFEAETRDEVIMVLKEMSESYNEGLNKHESPAHLVSVPLSEEEDISKYSEISMDLMSNLKAGKEKIFAPNYYAEAEFLP
jgi:hypothetical protein